MRLMVVSLVVLCLVAVACGSGGGHDAHPGSAGDRGGDTMDHAGAVPGEPADPSNAEREIEVIALDSLRFDPASIDVTGGETVTFIVRNVGKAQHEFVLGDEEYQEQHEADMQTGEDHMDDLDNAVDVAPGKTARLTWRFSDSGTVVYGCHEPGHYEGGMAGTVTIG
jgi:uncharacterized cupredoxin-like copper-binding protein